MRTSIFPYHVTIRSNNKEWFYLSTDKVWKFLCEHAFTTHFVYKARFHAFVLMSNHCHFLISTPEENLDQIMQYLTRELAKSINKASGRINRVFGGRYKWCLINSEEYFFNALKYIYQNPVRANICQKVEEYPYSTLYGILGYDQLLVPLQYPEYFQSCLHLNSFDKFLNWLNISYGEDEIFTIAKALRRTEFKYPSRTPNTTLRQLSEKSF